MSSSRNHQSLGKICEICNLEFEGRMSAKLHFESERHKAAIKGERPVPYDFNFICYLCWESYETLTQLDQHYSESSHTNRIKKYGVERLHKYNQTRRSRSKQSSPVEEQLNCAKCRMEFISNLYSKLHFESERHQAAAQGKVPSKEEPFLCFLCWEAFASLSKLYSHFSSPDHNDRMRKYGISQTFIVEQATTRESVIKSTAPPQIELDNISEDDISLSDEDPVIEKPKDTLALNDSALDAVSSAEELEDISDNDEDFSVQSKTQETVSADPELEKAKVPAESKSEEKESNPDVHVQSESKEEQSQKEVHAESDPSNGVLERNEDIGLDDISDEESEVLNSKDNNGVENGDAAENASEEFFPISVNELYLGENEVKKFTNDLIRQRKEANLPVIDKSVHFFVDRLKTCLVDGKLDEGQIVQKKLVRILAPTQPQQPQVTATTAEKKGNIFFEFPEDYFSIREKEEFEGQNEVSRWVNKVIRKQKIGNLTPKAQFVQKYFRILKNSYMKNGKLDQERLEETGLDTYRLFDETSLPLLPKSPVAMDEVNVDEVNMDEFVVLDEVTGSGDELDDVSDVEMSPRKRERSMTNDENPNKSFRLENLSDVSLSDCEPIEDEGSSVQQGGDSSDLKDKAPVLEENKTPVATS